MREYYRRYRDANASTADFRRVMEDVSGTNLGWFFQQWLERAGSPSVEWSWHYNADAKKVEVEVAQTQAGDPFRLPMELSIGGKIQRIEMTRKSQRFEVPSDAAPTAVELDPNTWILMDARLK
jgi:aminopeptidase N